jgi:hypothetical protein
MSASTSARLAGALGLAAWLACAAACAPAADEAADVSVECLFEPSPPRVGATAVEVVLRDAARAPVRADRVRIEGNMNHAGMVPEIADASEVEPGRHRAVIEFTMGGDWFVIVDAALADGRKLQRTVQVPAVAGE